MNSEILWLVDMAKVQNLQAWCNGCGEYFNMNRALNCKNGGLVSQRHSEPRDENSDLLKQEN